ncbi:alpha-galactosidase A precursor [Aspergillus crustosus]
MELLQAEADEADESFFRILVDGNSIKYLTIDQGLYGIEDMCFGPVLATIIPDLAAGDWNEGRISKDPENDGKPHFAHAFLDLTMKDRLSSGLYAVTHPTLFKDTSVVAKFARFDWEIGYMENETTAYSWIEGHDIGPRFLGHLTEHGRVIGFLIERVVPSSTSEGDSVRHSGPVEGDLEAYQETLAKLHALGIKHGDVNRFNFIMQGSKAVLIDYDTARKCDDEEALRKEMDALAESLRDEPGRGGGGSL